MAAFYRFDDPGAQSLRRDLTEQLALALIDADDTGTLPIFMA